MNDYDSFVCVLVAMNPDNTDNAPNFISFNPLISIMLYLNNGLKIFLQAGSVSSIHSYYFLTAVA